MTAVSQIGTDRIIDIQFSDGNYHLFLEFYASGNIIVTDGELTILSLSRNVTEGPEHEQLRKGLKYDLSRRQNYTGIPPLSKERIQTGLKTAVDNRQQSEGNAPKKGKQKGGDALRKALSSSINEFPPTLVDHAFSATGFDSTTTPEAVLESEALLDKLMDALQEAQRIVTEITSNEVVKGYIIAKSGKARAGHASETDASNWVYDEFHPFKPEQFVRNPKVKLLEFDGFNKTVDEFYSSIEGQKLESRLAEREETAKKKLYQARKDHENRIGGLQQVQELNIRKAEAIHANVERVEEAAAAVNGLIGQGMDWVDIGRLIEAEQKRNNPVAQLIKLPLKLYENTVTLLLGEAEIDDENSVYIDSDRESVMSDSEDDIPKPQDRNGKGQKEAKDLRLAIDIDLSLSAWANASQYYDQKRTAAVKEEKTLQASEKALKSAEKKIAKDLKKDLNQERDILRPVRKQFWFEKFYYFVSSDGYLVLAGRDAQQTELLYKRFLKKGDVYVHADPTGAPPVIIKNNPQTPEAPIPPTTLSQAGNLSISASSAWDSKAGMSAWWVKSDQVSKTAPTGEYLTTGVFTVTGKKNFLPPAQLLLGLAIVFHISEESKARHIRHRVNTVDSAADDEKISEHARDEAQVSAVRDELAAPEERKGVVSDTVAYKVVEDSEDEFPDVRMDLREDDSDEDFPDARLDEFSDDSDQDTSGRDHNPLQSGMASLGLAEAEEGPDDNGIAERNETPELDASDSQKTGRRHLSAYERRLLKKGIDPASVAGEASQEPNDEESDIDQPSVEPSIATTSKDKVKPLPRGKKGKAKRAAKYAEQDEEERELAMRLLGSKSGQEQAEAAAKAQREKEVKEAADKQRRRDQHQRSQAAGKAFEEARRAAMAAGGDAKDDDAAADEAAMLEMLDLDALVGQPLPGDEPLAAVPICAPWTALARYKFKAKMQPGTVKKGKAVKEILEKWKSEGKDPKKLDQKGEDVEKIWPREAELIKGLKETEVIGIVPVGKVKVMMAGGNATGEKDGSTKAKGKGTKGGKGGKKHK